MSAFPKMSATSNGSWVFLCSDGTQFNAMKEASPEQLNIIHKIASDREYNITHQFAINNDGCATSRKRQFDYELN